VLYQALESSDTQLRFASTPRARLGRALLYALFPSFAYLLILCAAFALVLSELIPGASLRTIAIVGVAGAAGATVIGFALGYRVRHQVEVTLAHLSIRRRPACGVTREQRLPIQDFASLALDPSLRSLGADILLVAVRKDGLRLALAEGDPHSGQLRQLAQRIAAITRLPLEPPKFTKQ
jgi:hypothetical protein